MDWLFNEQAALMALNEGPAYAWDTEKRAPYAQKSMAFNDSITDTLSKKIASQVKNRWDD